MKSAYIITNTELVAILSTHLEQEGYDVSGLSVRFTSTNAVVAGIEKLEKTSFVQTEDESSEEEEEEIPGMEGMSSEEVADKILEVATYEPKTLKQISQETGLEQWLVNDAAAALLHRVAPAREDGATVSRWMKPDTGYYTGFLAQEAERVSAMTARWADYVVGCVPKFFENRRDRLSIIEDICVAVGKDVTNEHVLECCREEIRQYGKAVFYKMAEDGTLQHSEHGWRMFRTEDDERNVEMLKGAIREVLVADAEGDGMSVEAIAEALPGETAEGLVEYALRRMDDVHEHLDLVHLSSN
jgi:hypothetical protein